MKIDKPDIHMNVDVIGKCCEGKDSHLLVQLLSGR